jgi:hypothetical protein
MKDCLGACTVSLVVLPFTLRRTGRWLVAEIAMVADRVTAVGLCKMKFSCRGGNSFARAASKRSRFNSISSRSLTCPSASNILSQTVKSQFVRPANTDPALLPQQLKAESVYHGCNLWDLFRRIYSLRTGLLKPGIQQGLQPSVGTTRTLRFFDPQCYENRGLCAAHSKDPEERKLKRT